MAARVFSGRIRPLGLPQGLAAKVVLTRVLEERHLPSTVVRHQVNATSVDSESFHEAELWLRDMGRFLTGSCAVRPNQDVEYRTVYAIPDRRDWIHFIARFCHGSIGAPGSR